ncbi:neuraminidase [Coniochaeta ligniaria NRRL 30616]|uniref:Neuraminidase n=1 Tax=Coniochaeta ligniaria NRRL 30616 TaxID=1408157 RepID=A0A1J7JKQ2_9PEZI|nr:neuraminidase [Coniochaeta ligniaria NRRL 30616]
MRSRICAVAIAFSLQTLTDPVLAHSPAPFSDFTNNTVFYPPADYTSWKTTYGRSLQLPDDSLLVTWENYPPEPPPADFPVFKSVDGGVTWVNYSVATDQVNNWGLRYQPHLYLLPQNFGGYAAGTILLAGASVPDDLSKAWLDLYASTDGGYSWEFVSHMVYGPGPELASNGDAAVWEPFLLMFDDQLVCYYSDQRDPSHGQKLSHITTRDLKTWSSPVDDVASAVYDDRPGMAIVAHIKSTNRYILTYEVCTDGQGCQAHYKTSSSPLTFGSISGNGQAIISSNTGVLPGASPYVIWTPNPRKQDGSGIIIMNGESSKSLFLNDDSAGSDGWIELPIDQLAAHSRMLSIINDNGKQKLLITGAGVFDTSADNFVNVGVMEIPTRRRC